MSLDYGWGELPTTFISKLIQILSNPQNLSNICRPATSILKKLVEADPRSAPGPAIPVASTSKALASETSSQPPGSVWRYGFDLVYEEMRVNGYKGKSRDGEGVISMLDTVVQRLASGDSMMALNRYVVIISGLKVMRNLIPFQMIHSMLLLNSLLKNATDKWWEELTTELERLNVRKAVVVSIFISFHAVICFYFPNSAGPIPASNGFESNGGVDFFYS